MENKKFINTIIQITAAVAVAVALTLISNYFLSDNTTSDQLAVNQTNPVQSPYEAKDLMTKAVVVVNYKNSVINGLPDGNFKKTISSTGKIESGYVYVKADVGGKSLGQYDNVYLKLENKHTYEELGGLLSKEKSFTTDKVDQYSEFLFDLSNVQYSTSQSGNQVSSGNWLNMLNDVQDEPKAILGFSSTEKSGNIDEIDIFYKCEDGNACSITVS